MKLKYCLTGILCLFLKSDAQQIRPLSVGDKVPDVTLKNIYNYPALQSSLSAFKNKVVILDFMATNCGSCIKKLPLYDSLQNVHADNVQFILVTSQPVGKIKAFLARHPELKLPLIASDTVLAKMFPHTYISHEVWIKDRVVKAITHPDYVTAGNIAMLVAKNNISLPVKNDSDTCKKYSIVQLYLHSYGLDWYPAKRILIEVKDSSRFFYNTTYGYKEEWKQRNRFCLKAIFRSSVPKEMRNHLDTYFMLTGRIVKRDVACFVLRSLKTVPATTVTATGTRRISKTALLYALGETYLPVIDETPAGITHMIVNENYLSDTSSLKKIIQQSGLELTTEAREIELLVISEPIIKNQKK